MNKISPKAEFVLKEMLSTNKSIRKIQTETGISKQTILSRARQYGRPGKSIEGLPLCDNCLVREIRHNNDAYRKTHRQKHKFCSNYCYGEFYRKIRSEDGCIRCGIKRKKFLCVAFTRGFCPKCYQLLRMFGFDENIVAIYEVNQKLKETIHGQKYKTNKYQRTSGSSVGSNHGS